MKRFFLTLILVVAGVKYGWDYLVSEKFQKYADETKAPWTCQVNNALGHLYMVLSEYERAEYFFTRTVQRCPEGEVCQVAEFEIAESLSKRGQNAAARAAYKAFVEKYPGTRRARIADRASGII